MSRKKIAVGCDHGGFILKEKLIPFLKKKGLAVLDVGTFSQVSMDYPDTAIQVASAVAKKRAAYGLLICKSGIGNCIVANKVRGVRAALCYNKKAAELSRRHNDANVLVLGALFVPFKRAREIIDIWLKTSFEGGRHARRVQKIERIEKICGCPF
jgi:ribose 5-phosphate isomerase B